METINENGVVPTEQEDQLEFSVSFEINENEHKVIFHSKKEKKDYIKHENLFCLKEIEAYGGAFGLKSREPLKYELDKKRMAFAIHSGFQQVAKTGVWNRKIEVDKIIA